MNTGLQLHARRLWKAILHVLEEGGSLSPSLVISAAEKLPEVEADEEGGDLGTQLSEEEFLAGVLHDPKRLALCSGISPEAFTFASDRSWEAWAKDVIGRSAPDAATWQAHKQTLEDALVRCRSLSLGRQLVKEVSECDGAPVEALETALTGICKLSAAAARSMSPVAERLNDLWVSLNSAENTVIPIHHKGFARVFNGGFRPGQLVVIGAPPGQGKSTVCSNFATDATSHGVPVLYFSYEMSEQEVVLPILSRLSGVNSKVFQGKIADIPNEDKGKLLAASKRLGTEPIGKNLWVIEASSKDTPATIAAWVRKIRGIRELSENHPVLVIVDYMQIMSLGIDGEETLPDSARVARIAHRLKETARTTKATILAISDVTKEAMGEALRGARPGVGIFKDSGRILHSADILIALQSGKVSPKDSPAPIDLDTHVLSNDADIDPRLRDQLITVRSAICNESEVFSRAVVLKQRAGVNDVDVWSLYRKHVASYVSVEDFVPNTIPEVADDL